MASRPLLLLIAYIGFVSLGLPDGVIGVAWPSVRQTFQLGQGNLGFIFLGAGCGYFLSSFFTGRLLGRIGIGVLLAGSSALVAASQFGFATAPLWIAFATCSILHGLGSGAIDAGLNHYVAHHFSARHMNWLHACYSIGATLGPLLMTAVLAAQGAWRTGYATIGSAMLLLSLLFIGTTRMWSNGGTSADSSQSAPAPGASMRETIRHPAVLLQMALFFAYTGLEVTIGQWSFTVLTEGAGIASGTAGLWVTCYWASIFVGRVLFGFIVERIGIDLLLRMSIATGVLGTALFAFGHGGSTSLVALVLIGLALAPIYPCLMTRTPERLGSALAAHAIGFQVSAAMIGAAVLPAIAGLLGSSGGLHMIPYFAIAIASALFVLHEILVQKRYTTPANLAAG